MRDIIFDCTELYLNPVRTGIQRVVREMLRNWPPDGPRLHVVRYESQNGLVRLSNKAVDILADREGNYAHLSRDETILSLLNSDNIAPDDPLPNKFIYFIPEVFYDAKRCMFYENELYSRDKIVAMLAYDFIVYLNPHVFNLKTCLGQVEYLRLIMSASYVAHISESTRQDYQIRVRRNSMGLAGPVLALGADGLNMVRQMWDSRRRNFVVLGSIDKRKSQEVIFNAFQRLWNKGHNIQLTIIGKAFASTDIEWLRSAEAYSNFRWLSDASDSDIRRELESARCTIYVSEVEGYGLPPVESLAAGVPVISNVGMPSLKNLTVDGQVRIKSISVEDLEYSVEYMMNDEVAETLWSQTESVNLSTWKSFSLQTADWLSSLGHVQ